MKKFFLEKDFFLSLENSQLNFKNSFCVKIELLFFFLLFETIDWRNSFWE